MTKMNNKARRVAQELKYTGIAIDTTDVTPYRGKGVVSRIAQDVQDLRDLFDSDAPVALLEYELLKLRRLDVTAYRELLSEFGMGYLG